MDKKVNILIVDDNISQRRTLSLILGRKGYTVRTAKDGPEALIMIKEQSFDIVFLDIKMPVMNGVQIYKRIKKISPEPVVVMMTAYAVEDLIEEAVQEGVYGVIYKPLDIQKMVALIQSIRKTKRGALILVVDDDPGTCTSFKNILARKGFEVGIAQSGEEAISLAREKSYDVLFIDMKLPIINGLETYLAIKEIHPPAAVIMMTGYRNEVDTLVTKALDNSAYSCLYKPFDMAKVLKLVGGILKGKTKDEELIKPGRPNHESSLKGGERNE